MSKVKRVVLEVLIVAVLAVTLIGGTLYYTYVHTDETAVPFPTVCLNGTELSPDSIVWNTPVFADLLYKPYKAQGELCAVPDAPSATLTFQAPAEDYVCTAALKGPNGTVELPEPDETGAFSATVTQNGQYTLDLTLSKLQLKGESFGLLHYTAAVTVAVEPKVEFSDTLVTQGGVLSVVVSGIMDGSTPEVTCDLCTPHIAAQDGRYVAYLGVHYNTAPGEYDVLVRCGKLIRRATVTVTAGQFARQDMTIDSTTAATANSAAALKAYHAVMDPLYAVGDETVYWEGQFTPPLDATQINTEYGLYRYTNGSSSAERHAGVDLGGEEGDPVYASNSGRVVYAGFLEVTGNTVVIEHGAGLKTFYFHMNSLNCKTGDMVQKGGVIGAVGSTGYSTGAHLHFEARIGSQAINPLELLDGTSGVYFAG